MWNFEQYLLDIGYNKYYISKNGTYQRAEYKTYSRLDHLYFTFSKTNIENISVKENVEDKIILGFNEFDKNIPVVLYPKIYEKGDIILDNNLINLYEKLGNENFLNLLLDKFEVDNISIYKFKVV